MGKLKLEVDSLAVVSYVTAPDDAGEVDAFATTRTMGCNTQTTECSMCTLVKE